MARWGINIFNSHAASPGHSGATRSSPDDVCITGFVERAERAGFPVMLGESTPRTMGTSNEPPQLLRSSAHDGNCLGFDFAAAALLGAHDSAPLQLIPCNATADSQSWRISEEGYLVSVHGMCVSAALGSIAAVAGECVPPPHQHVCTAGAPGCSSLLWEQTDDDKLVNHDGLCLSVGVEGDIRVADCSMANSWRLTPSSVVDHRGGMTTWKGWFEPYLKLIASPAVKAFCYIDWMWPAQPTGNGACWQHAGCWYSWSDARLELGQSSVVGGRWKVAMSDNTIIHSTTQQELCVELGCATAAVALGSAEFVAHARGPKPALDAPVERVGGHISNYSNL
jgi:hypothetical protein